MTLDKNILKKIKNIKFSKYEPTSELTLWAKPAKGNSYAFLVFNNGLWQPLSFSGEGGGGGPVSWNDIENKPNFATVATSGSYEDLTATPEIWSSSLPIPANPVAEEVNSIVTIGSVAQNLAGKEDALYYIPPIYYTESANGKTPTLITTDTSSFQTIVDVVTASGGGWDTVQYKDLAIPTVAAIEQKIPSEVTETTVAGWGFTKNTGTYSKPSGGIPSTDLASAVQTSLGKADTAIQTETDPVFVASAAHGISSSDITNWNGKTSTTVTFRQW